MIRAALYARKSTEDPQADSVLRQVAHGREAAARLQAVVVEEFVCVDDGVSGAEFTNRPGLLRLLAGARRRAFDLVVVSEPSRLGRDRLRTELVMQDLREAGVGIFAYLSNEEVRLDTPEHRFALAARAFSDELEREKARQRTRDALLAKARRGFVTGGVVFGYRNVPVFSGVDSSGNPIRSHVSLEIDPEQAEVVRAIFRMRADGYGLRKIARALNGDPFCTAESTRYFGGQRIASPRKGSGSWAPGGVQAMLKSARYLGQITWGRFKNTDRAGRTRLRTRQAPAAVVKVDAPQLRIIDDALWRAARLMDRCADNEADRRSGRAQAGTPPAPASLLSGLSVCGLCGGPIAIAGSHKRDRCYGCSYRRNRGATVCENTLYESVRIVDRRVVEEIQAAILVPEVRRVIFERATEIVQQRILGAQQEVDSLHSRLSRVRREIDNLVRAVEDGNAPAALLERLRERERERAAVEVDLARLSSLTAVPELDLRRIERLVTKFVEPLGEMLRSDLVAARAALRKLIANRVVFTPTATENGDRTYLVEAKLTLERVIPAPAVNSGSVPDGI
ncbi:MAG: recombinase family protein [Deltaproteobacteria bacterium]|nr:recombinase family protein [Deltaproteobacteria bacterium]